MEDKIQDWIAKLNDTKQNKLDLSRDEDLSISLMNLINVEEHLYFTAIKTENQSYLDILSSVREIRKDLMKRLLNNPQGEEWCICKHLLAASMRLIEVGTKELSSKRKKEANDYFKLAFDLYSIFFALNMEIINKEELKYTLQDKKENKILEQLSLFLKKMVDCCRE